VEGGWVEAVDGGVPGEHPERELEEAREDERGVLHLGASAADGLEPPARDAVEGEDAPGGGDPLLLGGVGYGEEVVERERGGCRIGEAVEVGGAAVADDGAGAGWRGGGSVVVERRRSGDRDGGGLLVHESESGGGANKGQGHGVPSSSSWWSWHGSGRGGRAGRREEESRSRGGWIESRGRCGEITVHGLLPSAARLLPPPHQYAAACRDRVD
jgi:hypothetical protein